MAENSGSPDSTRPGAGRAAYVTPALIRWRERTDGPLIALAVATIPLLALEITRSELTAGDRLFLDVVNGLVFVAFLADYVVELRLSSDRWAFIRHEWIAAFLVVTQGLAVVPALSAFGVVRGIRAVRGLRLLAVIARLFAIGGLAARDGRTVLRRHAAGIALAMAALTWLSSAVAFAMVEEVGEGQRLESFFDALWWSTATITTVGYGDIYPTTAAGRVVGGFTMLIGISTFAVVTAKVASFLVRGDETDPGSAT